MNKRVLLIGYGSIGKRHARNLMRLGIKPVVLTHHPDALKVDFVRSFKELDKNAFGACIISSATADHLRDLKLVLRYTKGIENILIEKPLEASYKKAKDIARICHGKNIYVGYNLRFLKAFEFIVKFIKKNKKHIRIVEVVAGEDLRHWRPGRSITDVYSAHRNRGGGVDLDLSHEIDYVFWLLGNKFKDKFIYRDKISSLRINSPDICKIVLEYGTFLVGITIDYIRPQKERFLKIACDNGGSLFFDLVTGALKVNDKLVFKKDELAGSYLMMMRAFLGLDKRVKKKLCTLKDAMAVLSVLEV